MNLGQRVVATMTTGVCKKGERGVIYERYKRSGVSLASSQAPNVPDMGVGVIFEDGGCDGFSPEEQKLMLQELNEYCPFAKAYEFQGVSQVDRDYRAGRFTFR